MIRYLSRSLGFGQLKGEGLGVLYLSAMAGLILMSYGLARGPSESLFLREFSHTLLPGLWIEVGLSVICVVAVYNYLLRFFKLRDMFSLSFIVTGLSLIGILYGGWGGEAQVFTWGGIEFPWGQTTLLRIWCDLYIVVFVEIFWSMANVHFPLKKATHIYGLLCAGGTLGSILGNTLVASALFSSPREYVLSSLITLPLLLTLNLLVNRYWSDQSGASRTTLPPPMPSVDKDKAERKSSLLSGLSLVLKSRYLIWILALVMLSQITVSLIDYEYKRYLRDLYLIQPESKFTQELYQSIQWHQVGDMLSSWWPSQASGGPLFTSLISLPSWDWSATLEAIHFNMTELQSLRDSGSEQMTAFQGWMYLSIDIGSLTCQLFTGWIIVHLGIVRTHLTIPLLLFTLMVSVLFAPVLLLIAAARSAAKFLTYSIFKSAKELLYVPLSYEEQTQGKAVIDIMVYRQAKILASVMLLPAVGLVTLGAMNLTILTLALWIFVVLRLRSLMGSTSDASRDQ